LNVRRLYSTFASGWPGIGLLLIRLVVGSVLISRAASRLLAPFHASNITMTCALLSILGILLIIGLWTPIVGTVIGIIEGWKIATLGGDKWLWLLLGTVAVSIAMLGPGLWSIDARLFGWKRVEPLPRKNDSRS
jgi:hypothetical protein